MKNHRNFILLVATAVALTLSACAPKTDAVNENESEFQVMTEQFADIQILRYRIPGWDSLTLQQKELAFYLSRAALAGRDMIWDQNYRYNLLVRKTLEEIVNHYEGPRSGDSWDAFMTYTKRVWFSNGIHHHYSTRKLEPGFDAAYLALLMKGSPKAAFPKIQGRVNNNNELLTFLTPILFDPAVDAKRVNQESGVDLVVSSANNFYRDVTQAEVEAFYASTRKSGEARPVWHGLNSRLVKEQGKIVEKVWKSGGLYGSAIDSVLFWLEKAKAVAENPAQAKALSLLCTYYRTGDLKVWDEYNIAWLADTSSVVDVVNGFIEVYGDPLGMRASYESVVSIRDPEATRRIKAIGDQAQWFEDHCPILPEHRKAEVTGISAKVITVVQEGGDATPSTPIGINLPNSDWIRKEHGSKSVSLGNIVYAYDEVASKGSAITEFAWDQAEMDRARQYGALAGALHTDLHEVIGHASGQLNPGIGTPKETLKQYASTLEEARADLVALFFIMDPFLIKLGVMESLETGKAEYDGYIRNGLMQQLRRLEPNEQLEESHMRNRQLIAAWAFEKGATEKVIERRVRDGKTFFVVNDYDKLRVLFGELLREIQRIKSEGDFKAGAQLVEQYGVKVDQKLAEEVRQRYARLGSRAYSGFIQPKLTAEYDAQGNIREVKVEYPADFTEQMLDYGRNHAHLPVVND